MAIFVSPEYILFLLLGFLIVCSYPLLAGGSLSYSLAAERLSSQQVEAALTLLERCADLKAMLVITGVGKNGIVARKIAATFFSIGLMALFFNPLDALHGDLGVDAPDEVCLLLSNSGETSELLEVLPHLKRLSTGRIAIVGRVESSLARGSDVVLEAAVDREVWPLNLAPTVSTAVSTADRRCAGGGLDGAARHLSRGLCAKSPRWFTW